MKTAAAVLATIVSLCAGCATAPPPVVRPDWPAAPVADAAPTSVVAAPVAAPAPAPAAEPPAAAVTSAVTRPVAVEDNTGASSARPRPEGLRGQFGAEKVVDTARTDLWERVRAGFAMPDLDNDLVRKWERYYATRPEYLERMMGRGERYLFHIVEEVQSRGLPMELALLPFIESAFDPQALSVAKAAGMWQFMPATGKHFELTQSLFRDDRRSVLASTRAALEFLAGLRRNFDDWHLALAAYNWGPGNVQRAQARNERLRQGTGYADLRMPEETRNYVPKLQAIKNLVSRPGDFGVRLPKLENHPFFLSVPIERDIDVALVLKLSGMDAEAFRALNPQHNKPVVLAAGTPSLLMPYDEANRFVAALAAHQGSLSSWTAWVAPRSLKPAEAAKLTGMTERDLREVNRIPAGMLVKAGSTLLVPRGARVTQDVTAQVADNARLALAPEAPARKAAATGKAKGRSTAATAKAAGRPPAQAGARKPANRGTGAPAPTAAQKAATPR